MEDTIDVKDFLRADTMWITQPETLRTVTKTPECALLRAILEDAIGVYQRYAFAKEARLKFLFEDAEEWILRDEPEWLCSFVSICHILGIDPASLRRGLKLWKKSVNREIYHKTHAVHSARLAA
jgi:hypothetical protein